VCCVLQQQFLPQHCPSQQPARIGRLRHSATCILIVDSFWVTSSSHSHSFPLGAVHHLLTRPSLIYIYQIDMLVRKKLRTTQRVIRCALYWSGAVFGQQGKKILLFQTAHRSLCVPVANRNLLATTNHITDSVNANTTDCQVLCSM
jgi:hypothetical protein